MDKFTPEPMDEFAFAPPDDLDFHMCLSRATRGQLPVYGVVQETARVTLKRAHESHHPEQTPEGGKVVAAIAKGWLTGRHPQPWLYVKDGCYIVGDDYFWLAFMERTQPKTFAAQILGEPLPEGLVQKVGPLGAEFMQRIFGEL
jgi:hypothetical protein